MCPTCGKVQLTERPHVHQTAPSPSRTVTADLWVTYGPPIDGMTAHRWEGERDQNMARVAVCGFSLDYGLRLYQTLGVPSKGSVCADCLSPTDGLDAIFQEHQRCGKPFTGCYSHMDWMTHCRADGMQWPCDVEAIRVNLAARLEVTRESE
jgi:hypothetical protein